MIDTITAPVLTQMFCNGAAAIACNKQGINELNVFPVPDGDTGTNMSLTMGAAAKELQKAPLPTVTKVADTAASALLRGARGNSGVILSLLFRGFSKAVKDMETLSGPAFAAALTRGVETAYKAVMKPAEGTILTVSRLTAAAAEERAAQTGDVEDILATAIQAGYAALAETIHQNPVLEKAGVIDAGGKGYLIILEGMAKALKGEVVESPTEDGGEGPKADYAAIAAEEFTFTFDTVFIVRKTGGLPLSAFEVYLNSIGDSLVIGEDDDCFKVHVHTDTPGAALTEAQKYGTLELAKIENMRTQVEDMAAGRQVQSTDDLDAVEAELEAAEDSGERKIAPPEQKFGMVAVSAGDGLSSVFRDLGVSRIVTGGQTMNPSTEDILREIDATPAEIVYVLPNNKNITMAAQQCIPLSEEKRVIVLPSRTIPQGISALLAFDPFADEATNTEAMTAAIGQVHTAQITYAARDSVFDGLDIQAGDYMALLEDSLLTSTPDLNALLETLISAFQAFEPEFLTIYYGADVTEADAQVVMDQFAAAFPGSEISLISGGQPVYSYLISAE